MNTLDLHFQCHYRKSYAISDVQIKKSPLSDMHDETHACLWRMDLLDLKIACQFYGRGLGYNTGIQCLQVFDRCLSNNELLLAYRSCIYPNVGIK